MTIGKTKLSRKAVLCAVIGGVIGAALPLAATPWTGKDVLALAWIPFGAFIGATPGLLIGSIVFPARRVPVDHHD